MNNQHNFAALPAGSAPNGATPNGAPTANAPPRRRPRAGADPLRAPRRPLKTISRPVTSLVTLNKTKRQYNAPSAIGQNSDKPKTAEEFRNESLSQGARSYPLVVSRKDLVGLRHHVMRLRSRHHINPRDERHFTPPVRLHRRDPRAPPSGAGAHFSEDEDTKEDIEESKERERLEILREERRKVREENQAQIAPTGVKKQQAFQKKTEQKYRPDDTPEARKRSALRYEETLPWHLEDFDNKQTWTGVYESTLSDAHVMLSAQPDSSIKMIPLEKWYRFQAKTKAKSTEDPDLVKHKASTYFRKLEDKARNIKAEEQAKKDRGLTGIRSRIGDGSDNKRLIQEKIENGEYIKPEADGDDIDFNVEEDFADDEEGLNGLFEGEEVDVKEAAEKVKRDQLAAAAFDAQDEKDVDQQEKLEKELQERGRQLEKALRKSLVKREKNIDYEDDGDDNPYESSSDSEESDSEKKAATVEGEDKEKEKETEKEKEREKEKDRPAKLDRATPQPVVKRKRPESPTSREHSVEAKKQKIDVSGRASPAHVSGRASPAHVSGRASPAHVSGRASPVLGPSAPGGFPTALEIYNALPKEGIGMGEFIKMFKSRVGQANTAEFIKSVKVVAKFDMKRRWLTPMKEAPAGP
ncbi:unnamed protein product [Periconia digitata]|uniref:Transcription initiation factor IIF subunit alpha n=1 Tax=Periconia digitata TaxID=1303443 RepID=A0A9W4UQH7_9PLEO|nr:unnamed protein product [Periconia digitata]